MMKMGHSTASIGLTASTVRHSVRSVSSKDRIPDTLTRNQGVQNPVLYDKIKLQHADPRHAAANLYDKIPQNKIKTPSPKPALQK